MEGFVSGSLVYQGSGPYPPVRAAQPNRRYAQVMLSNMAGVNSEMSAVGRYFYGHLVTQDLPEVASAFRHVSMVEMHHLEIFGTLAHQLGADPRLWWPQKGRASYWSAGNVDYVKGLGPLLHSAIREEQGTIQLYRQQTQWIQDANVVANLNRIIQDEQAHVELLRCLWSTYVAEK